MLCWLRAVKVPIDSPAGKAQTEWRYDKGHFIHKDSNLCLARNPNAEPGLVVLSNCSTANATNIRWTVQANTQHVVSDGVCLAVQHTNTTRCQCVF